MNFEYKRDKQFVNRPFTKFLSVAIVAAGSGLAIAQESDDEEEEVFELSPFEISADEDTGYRATSTLAGTRLRTDLKDIAASISVITEQFLEDTGATDNQSLLKYTTNTEVGGIYGNFSGLSNTQGTNEQAALIAPSGNTRVRGLDSADNTRNYFQSSIPWDGYNIGRVDLQRGPNSILFGVGSPAGIINVGLKSPMFENEKSFQNRIGSHGGVRSSFDFNNVLIEDVLAVRFTGLYDRKRYEQQPAFEDDQRIYGTLVYKPKLFGDSANTTVRGNLEFGEIEANRPRMLPPTDNITPYFMEDGLNRGSWAPGYVWQERVIVDPSIYPTMEHPEIVEPWMANSQGPAFSGNSAIMDITSGVDGYTDFAQIVANSYGAIGADGEIDNGIQAFPFTRRLGVGGFNAFTRASEVIDPDSYPSAAKNFYKDRSIDDPTIFDFYNNLMDGENKREWGDWKAYNLSFEQTFLNNRLGFEVVYNKEDYTQGAEGLFGWSTSIGVDINSHTGRIPTRYDVDDSGFADHASVSEGEINPNVGRAYISGTARGNAGQQEIGRENARVTLFGEIHGKDFFEDDSFMAKLIGRNVFTGLASRRERNDFNTSWSSWAMPEEFATRHGQDTDAPINGYTRSIGYTIYLTDDLRNNTSASGLNIGPVGHKITAPDQATVRYFNPTWNSTVDPAAPYILPYDGSESTQSENWENYVGWTEDTFDILHATNPNDLPHLYSGADRRTEILESEAITWQGYLFDGKLIPTYGWRKDKIETWGRPGPKDPITLTPSLDFENNKDFMGSAYSEGETVTWGIVLHSPDFINEMLPDGTDFSLFYNDSANFRAENRVGFDTNPLPNPEGESEDFGIVVRTLNDKLTFKATWYETTVRDANIPGGNALAGNAWFLAGMEAWGTALSLKNELYWAGEMPGMSWRSNPGLVFEGNWGADGWENAPFSEEALNHPRNVMQRAAIEDWYATMPPQEFFDGYGLPIDRAKAQGTLDDRRTMVDNGAWSPWNAIGGIQAAGGGKVNGLNPVGTINQKSRGLELELIAQPTDNWSLSLNASKTQAERTDLGESFVNFIEATKERLDGPAGDLRLWWAGDQTFREQYDAIIYQAYLFQLDANGSSASEIRPWAFNAVTSYNFSSGKFAGVRLGGAYRWQDDAILGYRLNEERTKLDINNPITGGAEASVDLWAAYERQISDDVNWKIQLNLGGVGKKDRLIPISVNPDGSPAAQRIAGGMTWSLTNTFSF